MPRALVVPENTYLNSLLFKSLSELMLTSRDGQKQDSEIECRQPQYCRPYAVACIADARLGAVDLAAWTSVCADNELMRRLLHSYLLADYQLFPFFHKDYFLDDMLAGSTRFCSSLLVNAVLAHACVSTKTLCLRARFNVANAAKLQSCYLQFSNRAEYWNPHSLGYKFFAEARRLWELERFESRSVTTVQAGMVINVTYNVYSMDKIGLSYGAQAASIAYEMGMFKPPDGLIDRALQTVRDYTAWCLYFSIRQDAPSTQLEIPHLT
jgi:hypothetical protein